MTASARAPAVATRAGTPFDRASRLAALPGLLRERIVVLDGAMGTMLQAHGFSEADFRGERFRDHPHDLRGDLDLLCLTQPAAVQEIHRAYLEAGADIVTTNSFTATRIAQADYLLEPAVVREMNVAAARLARAAADAAERARAGPPTLRGGLPWPHQPDGVDEFGRGRSGRPQRHLGGARGGLPRSRGRADRGRRGHPADRDDLRHAQRQGRHLRRAGPVR